MITPDNNRVISNNTVPPKAKESNDSSAKNNDSNKNTHTANANNNTSTNNSNNKTNPQAPPPDMITPSYVAKSTWNEVVDQLPCEDMQVVARTYTNRLHQLRLQREKHHGTHDRMTKPDVGLPASCQIRFELGASGSIKSRPEYQALSQSVADTIGQTQTFLKDAIVQLQVLEMNAKEEGIQKMFCEGLCKIALSVINYHRDNPEDTTKIAKTMQSLRLADRLVELLLEQHGHLLEYSFLKQTKKDDSDADLNEILTQYYQHVGRDVPTHSRKQNRHNPSSPYNDHHTKILEELLGEYKSIVEPCFHTSWKEYLKARTKLHHQQLQAKLKMDVKESKKEKDTWVVVKSDSRKKTPVGEKEKLPSAQALKEMVHNAVTEETQGLKETIRHLEKQLMQKGPPSDAKEEHKNNNNKGKGRHQKKNNNTEMKNGSTQDKNGKAQATHNKNGKAKVEHGPKAEIENKETPKEASAPGKKGKSKNQRGKGRGSNHHSNADVAPEGDKKANPEDDKGKDQADKEDLVVSFHEAKEDEKMDNTSTSSHGNKKKRNRHRNKGKGQSNANTNATAVIDKTEKSETAIISNGVKHDEAKNDKENGNGKSTETTIDGVHGGNSKAETENKLPNGNHHNSNGKSTMQNGTKNGSNVKAIAIDTNEMKSMHDSTAILFGSYHSAGDKKWG